MQSMIYQQPLCYLVYHDHAVTQAANLPQPHCTLIASGGEAVAKKYFILPKFRVLLCIYVAEFVDRVSTVRCASYIVLGTIRVQLHVSWNKVFFMKRRIYDFAICRVSYLSDAFSAHWGLHSFSSNQERQVCLYKG